MPIIESVNILKIFHIFHLVVVFGSKTISLISSLAVAMLYSYVVLCISLVFRLLYALFVVRTSIHLGVDAGLESLL